MNKEPINDEQSAELRILRMVKKVLTDIAKDTFTKPGLRHPLSEQTIIGIRECLSLITSREFEIDGKTDRPHFVDEPQDEVVVNLSPKKPKP